MALITNGDWPWSGRWVLVCCSVRDVFGAFTFDSMYAAFTTRLRYVEALQLAVLRVRERLDVLRREALDGPLDRLVERLVEAPERHQLAGSEEPLPPEVVALDRALHQVHVAGLDAVEAHGRVEDRRQLPEIGPRDGLAVAEADVHVAARRVDEIRAGQRIDVLLLDDDRVRLLVERVELDERIFLAHPADEPQAVLDDRQIEHAVPADDLLGGRERVGQLGRLAEP
jgi:hypothetical protein